MGSTGVGILDEGDDDSLNGTSNASDPPKCENSTGPLKELVSSKIGAESKDW